MVFAHRVRGNIMVGVHRKGVAIGSVELGSIGGGASRLFERLDVRVHL